MLQRLYDTEQDWLGLEATAVLEDIPFRTEPGGPVIAYLDGEATIIGCRGENYRVTDVYWHSESGTVRVHPPVHPGDLAGLIHEALANAAAERGDELMAEKYAEVM